MRSVEEVLALPFVPRLRLPDGKQAKLGVQLPWAPEADTSLPDKVVCERVAQLWCETHEVVFGRPDHRLRNAGKKGAKKQRELVLAWWEACALKNVRPAEWMLWALEGWKATHGMQKPAQPTGILSASRVLDGKKRRMFRVTAKELGGTIQYDEVGEALMRRVMLLQRRLELLVVRQRGLVSDDDVREIVAEVFPRGADNAAEILADVHQRCQSESMDLLRRAKLGSFVWPTEQ